MTDFLHRLFRNKAAAAAGALIALMLLAAVGAPWLAPHDPMAADFSAYAQPPGPPYWLGTDQSGRDVFSRLIHGASISLRVAGSSVLTALLLGGTAGVLAGYFGSWLDEALSRVTDTLFAFPDIVLALVILAVLGASELNLTLAIGIIYTPIFARIARGATLSVIRQPFIEAARAVGMGHGRIMLRHVLPNIVAPLSVQVTLSLAFAILAEAALSFLGVSGLEVGAPSWGQMLNESREIMHEAWWAAVFPGVAITLAVLSFNVLGDGLRDALDPRQRGVS